MNHLNQYFAVLVWFSCRKIQTLFMAVELYLYMGETGLSKKNHLGKISKWWWWWWLGHNDNDDGLTMTSCVSNNDEEEEEEHKDSNTIIIMMVAWRWLNVLAIINNYWTRLRKYRDLSVASRSILFAEAEGWGKWLICETLTNHDILQ